MDFRVQKEIWESKETGGTQELQAHEEKMVLKDQRDNLDLSES